MHGMLTTMRHVSLSGTPHLVCNLDLFIYLIDLSMFDLGFLQRIEIGNDGNIDIRTFTI